MSIESDFFAKTPLDLGRLESAKVRKDEAGYHLEGSLLGGEFLAQLLVSPSGDVSGRVIEQALGEEYLPLHALGQKGAFVTKVRSAYLSFLSLVADQYGKPKHFISEQLCMIEDWVFEAFGERPDYPFKRDTESAVFRNHENKKWYMVALRPKGFTEELIDVKVEGDEAETLLTIPGFLPAYHMHKKRWISIKMDGSVDDELIKDLVRASRAMTCEKVEELTWFPYGSHRTSRNEGF